MSASAIPTSSTTAAATSGQAAGAVGRATIAQNFDTFLTLLTTQLKNQSPLDPLDTNQFTQQMVQFASVEQQLKSNDTLSALLTSVKATTASTAASFIGKQVSADGATTQLTGGAAQWSIDVPRDAKATLTITDKAGSVVATQTKSLTAGANAFTWDGRTSTGLTALDGDYTLAVSATDVSGQIVAARTDVTGTVSSVDLSGTTPILTIGSASVPLSSIKTVAATRN